MDNLALIDDALKALFSPAPEPVPQETGGAMFPQIRIARALGLDDPLLDSADISLQVVLGDDNLPLLYRSALIQYDVAWNNTVHIVDLSEFWEHLYVTPRTNEVDFANIFAFVTRHDLLPRDFMTADFQAQVQERSSHTIPRVLYLEEGGNGPKDITFYISL